MIITVFAKRDEIEALSRNDIMALSIYSELTRYIVLQLLTAYKLGKRETYVLVAPPVSLTGMNDLALSVPDPSIYGAKVGEVVSSLDEEEAQASVDINIPDAFLKAFEEKEDEN